MENLSPVKNSTPSAQTPSVDINSHPMPIPPTSVNPPPNMNPSQAQNPPLSVNPSQAQNPPPPGYPPAPGTHNYTGNAYTSTEFNPSLNVSPGSMVDSSIEVNNTMVVKSTSSAGKGGQVLCIGSSIVGIGLLVAGFALTITLVLVLVLGKSTNISLTSVTTVTLGDDFANSMTSGATFPNGSYQLSLGSTSQAPSSYKPLQVNSTALVNAGIAVDQSNSLLVSGRQNFYYLRLPSVISQIIGFGISFGSSQICTVIPTSLTSISGSGVRLITLSDGTILIEIKVTAPSTLCNVSSSTCTSLTWNAYSIVSSSSVSAGISTELDASCGDQCSSGNSSKCAKSCSACSSQTVSGYDTPVSRQFSMGKTSGTFTFTYQTYTVKDRIKVVYQDTVLFNTGCVGASGTKSLSFSGKSSEIRVDVEPNCDGTTGTAWDFTIGCS